MAFYTICCGVNVVRNLQEKMRQYWSDKLKAGWSPFTDELIIYEDNLGYQTYIKKYKTSKSKNGTFRFFASQYPVTIQSEVDDSIISSVTLTFACSFAMFFSCNHVLYREYVCSMSKLDAR